MRLSNKTMGAIATLISEVDGGFDFCLKLSNGDAPKGKRQDYEGSVKGIRHEYVDQYGPGMAGDDFHGTVAFVLGDYHLYVGFAT